MDKLVTLALELQSLAQAGLFYEKNVYELERYARIREIAAEILENKTQFSLNEITDTYCQEVGYQTPKVDTRSAIFKENRILLVQETTGLWALPGGWCDILLTPSENAVKEVKEETGLDVSVERVIAIQDRAKHNAQKSLFTIYKLFVLCQEMGGSFQKNSETIATAYFSLDNLPPLAEEKTTREQIKMCFNAYSDPNWQTLID